MKSSSRNESGANERAKGGRKSCACVGWTGRVQSAANVQRSEKKGILGQVREVELARKHFHSADSAFLPSAHLPFDFPFMSRLPKAIKVFLAQWTTGWSMGSQKQARKLDGSRDCNPPETWNSFRLLSSNFFTNHRLSCFLRRFFVFVFPPFRLFSFSITNWFSRTWSVCDFSRWVFNLFLLLSMR